MGYDGVEIPLFDLSLDYTAWGKRLKDLGLQCTAVTVRGGADNPISPDPKNRARGRCQTETDAGLLPGCRRSSARRALSLCDR